MTSLQAEEYEEVTDDDAPGFPAPPQDSNGADMEAETPTWWRVTQWTPSTLGWSRLERTTDQVHSQEGPKC